MDIRTLQHFLTVAEQGSLSRAASMLGLGQPALGRQVRQLEAHCGTSLFYRHGRGVALTDAGQALQARLQPLLRQLADTLADLDGGREEVAGRVTVAMTPTVLNLAGMALLRDLQAHHPGVRVNIVSGYSGYIHEWLLDGRADIAILHDARRSHHIAVDPLARADLFLISAPDVAGSWPDTVPFDALAELPLVLPSAAHGLRRTLDSAAVARRVRLHVCQEADTLTLMVNLALSGMASTVLAMPAVWQAVRDGTLRARRLVQPALQTRLMLATAQSQPLTRAGRVVLARLRAVLAEQVAGATVPLHLYMEEDVVA